MLGISPAVLASATRGAGEIIRLLGAFLWSARSVPRPSMHPDAFTQLGRRVLVVSPHLDDAVFSLGATLARHVRRGGDVTILTVIAGLPMSKGPASAWDRSCGFSSEAAAATARRQEDREACAHIGARYLHLDGSDDHYERPLDLEAIATAVVGLAQETDEILLPGYPLQHADHRSVATTVAAALRHEGRPFRLYAEEPYASRPASNDQVLAGSAAAPAWGVTRGPLADQLRKLRAAARYRSQLATLASGGHRVAPVRMLGKLWAATRRGEWLSQVVDEPC